MKASIVAFLVSLISVVSFSVAKSEELSCVVDVTDNRFPIELRESMISDFTVSTVKDGMRVTVEDAITYRGSKWSKIKDSGWLPRSTLDCSKYDKRDDGLKMFRRWHTSSSGGVIGRFMCDNVRESESTGVLSARIKVVFDGLDPRMAARGGILALPILPNGAIGLELARVGVIVHHAENGDINRADEFDNDLLDSQSDGEKVVLRWTGHLNHRAATRRAGNLSPTDKNDYSSEWIYAEYEDDLITHHKYQMRAFCHADWITEQGEKVDWKNN